jgi:threonine dehydrogenase-like Zn-dependent dehydrogenase
MQREFYVLSAPRHLERVVEPIGVLPPDRVRVRYLYCGICGTDLLGYEGGRPLEPNESMGHEFIAEVTEVGSEVDTIAVGSLVTSDLNYRCGTCDQCQDGRSHLCRTGQIGDFSNRGFANVGDLHWSYLVVIDAPPAPHLTLVEPLACALHALRHASPAPGERVLVVGGGGIGTCMALALSAGSIPFDIAEPMAARREAIGTAAAPYATAAPAPEGEYDVVLEVSGSPSGMRAACDHVRPGGRICTMSHMDDAASGDFLLRTLTPLDVSFTISYLDGPLQTMSDAADLLISMWNPRWEQLIEVVPAEQLDQAVRGRRGSTACKTIVDVRGLTDERPGTPPGDR